MSIIRIKDGKPDVMNDDLVYRVGSDSSSTTAKEWWRGDHCNMVPSKHNLKEADAIEKYVLQGWLPKTPFITKDTYVTAFGSCFAQNIRKRLLAWGANMAHPIEDHQPIPIINNGEGINTTFAILQQFLWAYENEHFDGKWHDKGINLIQPNEEQRIATKQIFDKTEVFILTLGLSEIWYDRKDGEVFWRAIPKDKFDATRHAFRVSDVSENFNNLQRVVKLIKTHRPEAKIIFTLSPVPLNATFRPVSCITANSVSKAVLRVAVDQLMQLDISNVYYWPAYEIVTSFFADAFEEDNRHPKKEIISTILDQFMRFYT